ncbi:MAG: hypothetical protein WC381_08190 [Kiritimatiellia bacterium]
MDAIDGQQVALLSLGPPFGYDLLHIGIQVGEEALLLHGQGSQKIVIGREFLVIGAGRIFIDHRRGENHDPDPLRLRGGDDSRDIRLVGLERHAAGATPHVVDPTA